MNSRSGGVSSTIIAGVGAFLVVVCIIAGLAFGLPAYSRYQARANAQNNVKVTAIQIANTAQLVQVQKQKAEIRVADAQGIADSQKIINNTLTPMYIQYLAIQAQIDMANGSNHTVVYIPVGQEGIPIIGTTNTQNPSNASIGSGS